MRLDVRFFMSCGASGQGVVTSVDYGQGWVNKPSSVSARIPRSVSRLSLTRALLMLLGATGRSIARQAIQVVRWQHDLSTRKLTVERIYLITSLSVFDATCTELATWIRFHRGIESLVHHVRDRTFREGGSKIRPGTLPRAMASLRNVAITVFRQDGQTNIAAALRHTGRDYRRPL